MSVAEIRERHALAKTEVQKLREQLRTKRASLCDTDGVGFLLLLLSVNPVLSEALRSSTSCGEY